MQRRVVAPLHGVADLRVEGRQLGQRLDLGVLAHPVEASDRLAVGVEEALDECIHRFLCVGREMTGDPRAAHGVAQVGLDEGQRALPPGTQLLRTGESAAVEVEVLLHEIGREQGGAHVDGRCAQPLLEGGQVGAFPQGGRAAQEVGLVHVDDEAADGHAGSARPGVPVEAGGKRCQAGPRRRVIRQERVAVRHRVAVMRGQGGLQGHDALRRAVRVGHARQRQETSGVGDVGLAN